MNPAEGEMELGVLSMLGKSKCAKLLGVLSWFVMGSGMPKRFGRQRRSGP